MSNKPKQQNPADIAREAFRLLATRRIAPTPDAYKSIYNEIAGIKEAPPMLVPPDLPDSNQEGHALESILASYADNVASLPGDYSEFGKRLIRACKIRDWDLCSRILTNILERSQRKPSAIDLLAAEPLNDSQQTKQLRDMLSRTLNFALPSLLHSSPDLMADAESLGAAAKLAQSDDAYNEIASRLKQLCYRIELRSGDNGEQQELLFRLFKLLLENVSGLLDDDSWLRGQIEVVQDLISGPLDSRALEDATRSLKEVIYKQSQLKHSLTDAKTTVKNMMITFVDRLSTMATSTGDYHEKIGEYSEKISHANNINELNDILNDVLAETR
ncbi:MAG: hypothetical protein RL748_664, partial [Pseudomonadota bacterium]